MRGSVTTACPSAASVGASTTARITASSTVSSPKIAAAATAPSAIVSGSPMPSSRTGSPTSRRSCPRSMREASQKSTNASVASASVRTVPLELSRSTLVEHLGPDQQADGDEHHRRRDRRARQPPRDRGDAEQRQRDDGERPLHGSEAGLDGDAPGARRRSSARRSRARSGRRRSRRTTPSRGRSCRRRRDSSPIAIASPERACALASVWPQISAYTRIVFGSISSTRAEPLPSQSWRM